MRSLYFTAAESGMTRAQLRHGESTGRWVRLGRANDRFGSDPATQLDECLGPVAAAGGVVCGRLAGVLLGLDDLAGLLDDLVWEQALEPALRKKLVCVGDLQAVLPDLARRGTPGSGRIRRVLALRPPGAPPTGSLLETLFVQLRRHVPGSSEPGRQVEVRNRHGDFVAFVDFAWPELGIFIELDGQQHAGQPVYDATRETAVVAATGWLVGRFTWDDIVHRPRTTRRRLEELLARAAARPLVD